jgi:hypothetical protein
MNKITNFETYLFTSPKKLIILVSTKNNQEKIYKKELILNTNSNELDLKLIDDFLKDNIFKIEKLLKNFVENIYLIINSEDFCSVNISIKQNNYGELINNNSLINPLYEVKDQCKKTLLNQKIIHLLIDEYQIDGNRYASLPKDVMCDFFSLNVRFICLPIKLIKDFEEILKKYQISVNQIVSEEYTQKYFTGQDINLFEMTKKIISGCNENEVALTSKSQKNKGFFEKFFDFFG